MATYKSIKGFNIQSVSSDPPAPFEGEVWYNSGSNTLKYFANVSAGWSTGAAITGRYKLAGAGIETAGLVFGGNNPANSPPLTNATEEYNGTSWSPGGNMSVARSALAGAGTQTAALAYRRIQWLILDKWWSFKSWNR